MSQAPSDNNSMVYAQKQRYLQAMGVDIWVDRSTQIAEAEALNPAPNIEPAKESPPPVVDHAAQHSGLNQLKQKVASCTACVLHETRTQTVFGAGNENADWLFVGEAPGADEDRQGEPFVGHAGKLLNSMLFALGLQREQVFIANVLKCRPPDNRDPRPEEVDACENFLQQQINSIQPSVIVALGRHAAHALVKSDQTLAKLRGKEYTYGETPLVITYHPAYLLRSPADKAKAWADLCFARKQAQKQ